MQITLLQTGKKYKTTGRQELKIVTSEVEARELIPSGTTLTVIRVNEKSVRVEFKFRDKDRENYTARLPFDDNSGELEIKEI